MQGNSIPQNALVIYYSRLDMPQKDPRCRQKSITYDESEHLHNT